MSVSGSVHVEVSLGLGRFATWPTPAITGVRGSSGTRKVCRAGPRVPEGSTVGFG